MMTNTRKLTILAVLSALSFLLMIFQMSVGIGFLKVDFSTIPILLALVLFDLRSSLPINIVAVFVFVLAFALIWNKKQTLKRFVLASLVGTLGITIAMLVVNYYYAIPLYAKFVGFDIAGNIGVEKYLLGMVVPFNLLEGLIWAVSFWMVHTLIQSQLKLYEK